MCTLPTYYIASTTLSGRETKIALDIKDGDKELKIGKRRIEAFIRIHIAE